MSTRVTQVDTLGILAVLQQSPTNLNAAPTVSGANSPATVTLAGASGQRVTIRGIYIKATGAAATVSVTVQDGATVVLDLGTISVALGGATVSFGGALLLTGSLGNSMVVNIGAGGALAVVLLGP